MACCHSHMHKGAASAHLRFVRRHSWTAELRSVQEGERGGVGRLGDGETVGTIMNVVNEIRRINEEEARLGICGTSASWHDEYKDTAWVFVGNVPYRLTEGDVVCIFSQYGEIEKIEMKRDEDTGKMLGFGWIKYMDQRSTILAVDNLGGADVLGRTLRVDHARFEKAKKKKKKGAALLEDSDDEEGDDPAATVLDVPVYIDPDTREEMEKRDAMERHKLEKKLKKERKKERKRKKEEKARRKEEKRRSRNEEKLRALKAAGGGDTVENEQAISAPSASRKRERNYRKSDDSDRDKRPRTSSAEDMDDSEAKGTQAKRVSDREKDDSERDRGDSRERSHDRGGDHRRDQDDRHRRSDDRYRRHDDRNRDRYNDRDRHRDRARHDRDGRDGDRRRSEDRDGRHEPDRSRRRSSQRH